MRMLVSNRSLDGRFDLRNVIKHKALPPTAARTVRANVRRPQPAAFPLSYTRRMPKFDLSAHAKTVVAERSIELEWLERVPAKPEKIEADRDDPELRHALWRIQEHGDRVLRVVYNDWFVSKNCGAVRARVICQVHDRAQFLSWQRSGNRRLFSW
jgi:hypothetical protein